MTSSPPDSVEHLLRELAPQVLGAVVRRFRDFAACEDAVQEALIAAAGQWSRGGVPDHPRGWLIQVAFRRMTDHIRSEISRRNRERSVAAEIPLVVAPAIYSEPEIDPDDTLLAELKTYEAFPKSEAWISEATARLISKTES